MLFILIAALGAVSSLAAETYEPTYFEAGVAVMPFVGLVLGVEVFLPFTAVMIHSLHFGSLIFASTKSITLGSIRLHNT